MPRFSLQVKQAPERRAGVVERAYSLLEVKSVEEDRREIQGVATTPAPDRLGDIVEPLGIEYRTPLPLLWQHRHTEPVGHVWFDKPTKEGITFRAALAKVDAPGELRDRIEKAWQHIKAKLVGAVSIGFRALEVEPLDAKDPWGPVRFVKSEVLELSLVTIPANVDATIDQVRSLDEAQRAATGRRPIPIPGVTGERTRRQEGTAMRTLAEQIASLEATRAAKAARMTAIMQKAADEGRSTDQAEQEEFDTLNDELEALDGDLTRLAAAEKANKTRATPPVPGDIGRSRVAPTLPPAPIVLKQELPKGTAFTRYVMALAAAKGNRFEAMEIARRWQNSTPEVLMLLQQPDAVIRAAVVPGTTTDADWAQPLVAYQTMASEFLELLRPATIIGRIPGIRMVPFMIKIPTQTQASLVGWVGEAQPKPVSELKFGMIQLDVNKVAGIVVLSEELVRLSTPSAEGVVRQDLTAQIAQFLDVEFIDPANAAVAGISPASILNGIAGIPSSGPTVQDVRTDLQALINAFIGTNMGLSDAVFITTESIALQLGMLQNPLGQQEFSGLGLNGGTLLGRPLITSQSVPAGLLILVKAGEILMADDGGVSIYASREATLQMDSAPVTANPATFSLWQNNCVGIRAERWITWRRRRDQAAAYITGANYTGVAPVTP